MIAVSQGFERSISIEVFIKAFFALTREEQKEIIFFCHIETVNHHLNTLGIPFTSSKDMLSFSDGSNLHIVECSALPTQTSSCLVAAIEFCRINNAKLLTMPSRKDQFIFNNTVMNGHTGFLREYFKNNNAFMMFFSENYKIALMTEHVALDKVGPLLTKDFLENKLKFILSNYPFYLENIYISGINPHCGENGIYGSEDKNLIEVIKSFQNQNIKHLHGPFSGDTLSAKLSSNNLGIFMFHDQALSFFKFAAGKFGLNVTVGLPIERVSVDHGTAEDIFLKNCADYSSTLYALNFLLKKSPSKN